MRTLLSRVRQRVLKTVSFIRKGSELPRIYPVGHYYSPQPEPIADAIKAAEKARLSPAGGLPGIDLGLDRQRALLEEMVTLYPEFDWPELPDGRRRFHLSQDFFRHADSLVLYCMLRLFKPRRVVEVGSGFSSALMLDVWDRHPEGRPTVTFIEPNPKRLLDLLKPEDTGTARIVTSTVQNAGMQPFLELVPGDVLFVDGSHVAKAGSDVQFLVFEVLPRLANGVYVHFHDVFWPFEYPPRWIEEGCAWNEAYVLRAFLTFNKSYEVTFWAPMAARQWGDFIGQRMPLFMKDTGGSLWLRRVA